MTALTPDQIAAIQARVDAATPGEWYADHISDRYDSNTVYTVGDEYMVASRLPLQDAVLIAHAPSDLRALLAEVARLTAALDAERRQRETTQTMVASQADRIAELTFALSIERAGRAVEINPAAGEGE